jgi:hypothetical protein
MLFLGPGFHDESAPVIASVHGMADPTYISPSKTVDQVSSME